jgi:hypothetical protein
MSVEAFQMDTGVFSISEAAVISYSTHHLLFFKTKEGEELAAPAYLPDSARRSVYGKKTSTALPPTA